MEWSKCKYRLYMQCSASSAHRLDSIREIAQKHNLESPAAVGGHMQSLWTRFMKGATVAMRSFKEKTNEVLHKFGVDYNFDEPCLQTLGFSKGVVPPKDAIAKRTCAKCTTEEDRQEFDRCKRRLESLWAPKGAYGP